MQVHQTPAAVVKQQDRPEFAGDNLPNAIVYAHSLLAPSMTFILSHGEALRRHRAIYAGAHRIHGLPLPEDRVVTANRGGPAGRGAEFLFRRFGIAPRFFSQLRAYRPRIVHAHFGPSGPSALCIARRMGVPLVQTYHGRDATMTEDEARRSWRGRAFLRARDDLIEHTALFIAVSDFIRSKLLEQGFPEDRVVTHRNGIDIRFFSPVARAREPIVVFVGRFVEKKGCEYLLRALARSQRAGVAVRGVLVGDGPLRPALEALAQELQADVVFTGFVPLHEVKAWIGRASVVAVPSVTASDGDSEGLPTVVLEAQAMATPVIATRHAGTPEGVREGRTALLFEERDVDGLAAGIRFFIETPDAIAQFGAAGRAFVEESFALEKQVAGIEDLYDWACGMRRAGKASA